MRTVPIDNTCLAGGRIQRYAFASKDFITWNHFLVFLT